jgi:flagellar biosynthetic protein FlhB
MSSKQQLLTTLKACLLALVLGVIGALYLRAHTPDFADALTRPVPAAVAHALDGLAHVYQLRAALAGRAAMPGDLPPLQVPPELDPHSK